MSSVPFDGFIETIAAQIAHAGAQPWAELTDINTLTATSQILAPLKSKAGIRSYRPFRRVLDAR